MSRSCGHLALLLKIVTAAYLAALATLPLAHHDLLCHLKSSTHCTSCLVSSSADDDSTQPAVASISLADAGQASDGVRSAPVSCVPASSPGRSPPHSSRTLA